MGSGEVGAPVGLVLLPGVVWLVMTEVEDTSGNVDDRGECDETGV